MVTLIAMINSNNWRHPWHELTPPLSADAMLGINKESKDI
jgi:hypothetical protein